MKDLKKTKRLPERFHYRYPKEWYLIQIDFLDKPSEYLQRGKVPSLINSALVERELLKDIIFNLYPLICTVFKYVEISYEINEKPCTYYCYLSGQDYAPLWVILTSSIKSFDDLNSIFSDLTMSNLEMKLFGLFQSRQPWRKDHNSIYQPPEYITVKDINEVAFDSSFPDYYLFNQYEYLLHIPNLLSFATKSLDDCKLLIALLPDDDMTIISNSVEKIVSAIKQSLLNLYIEFSSNYDEWYKDRIITDDSEEQQYIKAFDKQIKKLDLYNLIQTHSQLQIQRIQDLNIQAIKLRESLLVSSELVTHSLATYFATKKNSKTIIGPFNQADSNFAVGPYKCFEIKKEKIVELLQEIVDSKDENISTNARIAAYKILNPKSGNEEIRLKYFVEGKRPSKTEQSAVYPELIQKFIANKLMPVRT